MSKEGAQHPLLQHDNKVTCEFCGGTTFQLGIKCDENTDLPATTKAVLWENDALIDKQTIVLLCQCGAITGKLAFAFDVCTARGAGSFTGTNLDAAVADGLKGLYVTVLGGTDVDKSFPITANSAADPTALTVTGTPNLDAIGEPFVISSFNSF